MSQKCAKFDLVHQTVSPCERVGSGDETRIELAAYLDEPTGTESSSAQTPEDMFILNYT